MYCADEDEDILAFDTGEQSLVSQAIAYLRQHNIDEALMVERRFRDIEALAKAISRFPPVCQTQLLAGIRRDSSSLASSLTLVSGGSRLLHTPTRVIASRSFLVAKYHAFSLLAIALGNTHVLIDPIRNISLGIVFTLMIEDVYISCLEDSAFPADRKDILANELVRLWDRGRDPRASVHIPCLKSLWAVRTENPPSFGTLEGTSELVRISMDMDDDWSRFIAGQLSNGETRSALEEFLFGLSNEELAVLRLHIHAGKLFALDNGDIQEALGRHRSYIEASDCDARLMYEFYVQRREAAKMRRLMAADGPHHTIEELYLGYRFAQDQYMDLDLH